MCVAVALCCAPFVSGCFGPGVSWTQDTIGTFPSQVETQNGWQVWSDYAKTPDAPAPEYMAYYYCETSDPGGDCALQDKHIWIRVAQAGSKDGPLLLDDELSFRCCAVKAYVRWETFETLEVDLIEEGHQYVGEYASANETYMVELAQNGPRRLARLTYTYDKGSNQFVRARANYPPSEALGSAETTSARRHDIAVRIGHEIPYLIAGDYSFGEMYDSTDLSLEIEPFQAAFDNAVDSGSEYVPEPSVAWFRDASSGEYLGRVTFVPRSVEDRVGAGDPLVIYVRDNWELKLTGVKGRTLVPDETK